VSEDVSEVDEDPDEFTTVSAELVRHEAYRYIESKIAAC